MLLFFAARVREQHIGRLKAALAFFALTVPFGIAVHLIAELAELGASAQFWERHRYLPWLAAASVLLLAALLRSAGGKEPHLYAARLTRALPFNGTGVRFFALSCALQYGVFSLTQYAEGDPMRNGSLGVGLLAALLATVAGALILSFAKTSLLGAVAELAWFITGNVERSLARDAFASRHAQHPRLHDSGSFQLCVAIRPPPQHILTH